MSILVKARMDILFWGGAHGNSNGGNYYKVTNLYWDPAIGKVVVEFDNTLV
jgi:hypothetical protein